MTSVSFVTVIVFSLLRPRNKVVYSPKTKQDYESVKGLPILSDGFFSWVKPMFTMKESDLVDKIGLDAVTFIRFLRLLCEIFILTVVLCCGALIPVNIVYNIKNIDENDRTWLDASTIMNLGGRILWVHCGVSYAITGVILWRIWIHTREMVDLRNNWFRSEEYQTALYARTLMITNLPRKLMSDQGLLSILKSDPNSLKSKKKRSIDVPYEFSATHVSRKVGRLPQLIEKHNEAVRKLEQILTTYFKKGTIVNKPRPLHRVDGIMCFGGKKVDAITYYTEKIKRYEHEIGITRDEFDFKRPDNFGFASLVSIPAAHIVAEKVKNKHPNGTNISLAPNPKDIIWENLTHPPSLLTKLWGWIILAFVCFLNTIPLIFISFLANISATAVYFKGLRDWSDKSPWTFSIMAGILPPLVSGLFAYFLPIIMRSLSKYKGAETQSRLDRAVIARFFAFLVISQLLIFTLISVGFNLVSKIISEVQEQTSFVDIVKNMSDLPQSIQSAYVGQSSYWLKWFPLRGFLVFFDLAQLANLIFVFFKKHMFGRTPRDYQEYTKPPPFEYAVYYSSMLFMTCVGLVYAPIAPLVAAAALVIFLISAFIQKYQLMYVFVTEVETGGRIWNVVINRLLFSLMAMQAIVLLSLGLLMSWDSGNWAGAIPPMIGVIVFKYVLNHKFSKIFDYYLPDSEEAATSKVHNQKSDVKHGRLAKRFGHSALHAELFNVLVHDKHVHLLEEVLPESVRRAHDFKEDILSDGLKFEAITEEQLEEIPIRDRGEMDWDVRSRTSTAFDGSIDRHGAATPAMSIREDLMKQYYSLGKYSNHSYGNSYSGHNQGLPSISEYSSDTFPPPPPHPNDFTPSNSETDLNDLARSESHQSLPLLESIAPQSGSVIRGGDLYSPVNLNDDERTPRATTYQNQRPQITSQTIDRSDSISTNGSFSDEGVTLMVRNQSYPPRYTENE